MSQPPAPLDGITVLDLSTVGPATRCARIIADYGAQVIKVGVPPKKLGLQTQPAFWSYSANRGMQQVRIDLKAPEGKAAFCKLVETADVVIESYRPGVMKKLGLSYEDLRAINPRIVFCSTSGFGQDGPASLQAGHDINYMAAGGFLHTSNRRGDGGPPIPGATVADSAAGGMHAALAIFAALMRRHQTGEGEYLDVCVAEGVLWLTSLYVDQYLATGDEPGPGHDILTGRYACYDTYAASDGKWIAVSMFGSIWKVEVATGAATQLTHNGKYHSAPEWSPDGEWIIYTADDDGQNIQLEIVNVVTGRGQVVAARRGGDPLSALAELDRDGVRLGPTDP